MKAILPIALLLASSLSGAVRDPLNSAEAQSNIDMATFGLDNVGSSSVNVDSNGATLTVGGIDLFMVTDDLDPDQLVGDTANDNLVDAAIMAPAEVIIFGTALPGAPTTGDVFIVTDDSVEGACDSAAGAAITLCRYNGATWDPVGDGGAGGGGDSITVNTVAVVDPDFDDAAPAAPAGDLNVKFQTAANDISAYVDVSVLEPLVTLSNLAGSVTDGQVPDNITLAGATIGTSTITLNDGAPPTADGVIEFDSTSETIQVGDDGVATLDFYPGPHDGTGTDDQNLSVTVGGADDSVIDIEDGTDVTISGGTYTNVTEAASTITVEADLAALQGAMFTDIDTDYGAETVTVAWALQDVTGKQLRNSVAVDDDSCVGEQGNWWYDTTDERFEFCNNNSGAPATTQGFTPTDLDTDYPNETVTTDYVFIPNGTGAMGAYDVTIGDTGSHGAIRLGDAGIYNSSFSTGIDLGQAIVIRQEGALDAGNDPGIEFAIMENVSNTVRFAIPESAAGNATAMIRSVTMAGPYSAAIGNDIVTCDQWSTYDSNIDCDTSGTGADLFVQDDLEVEGEIFLHGSVFTDADDANQHEQATANITADRLWTWPDDEIASGDLLQGTGPGTFGFTAKSAINLSDFTDDLTHNATAITDGLIIEPDLNTDNVATDGDILTYDSTGTNFAWITPNAGTDITADLEEETHASEHQNGGADEISVAGLSGQLADGQLVAVSKNSGATVGTRSVLNLIEGANITLTVTDDAGGDEVDITIAASGGGAGGIEDHKESVVVVATSDLDLTGEETIDGVLTSTDRVLVTGQSTGSENGIYLSDSGAWTRVTDADADSEVTAGLMVQVEEGTTYADSTWVIITDDPITVDTTSISFSQINNLASADLPHVMVRHNTTGSLPSSWAAFSFAVEDYDTDAFHDTVTNNSRITIPSGMDGLYWVACSASLNGTGSTDQINHEIWLNGSFIRKRTYGEDESWDSSDDQSVHWSGLLQLSAADYIECGTWTQLTPDFATYNASQTGVRFEAVYLNGVKGQKGDSGADGTDGESFNWAGTWDGVTAYVVDDVVENNDDSYICTTGHTNQEPPNATYWDLFVGGGAAGGPATGAYRTQPVMAGAMVAQLTNGPQGITEEHATNDVVVDYYLFDGATAEYVQFTTNFDEAWNLGTIKARFFWDGDTGASGGDGVAWEIACQSYADSDAIDTAFPAVVTTTDTLITLGDVHETAASAAVTVSNSPAQGDMIQCRINRDPTDGSDTMTEDAKFIGVLLQYLESETEPVSW